MNKVLKIFIIAATILAALTTVFCMMLFDSDFSSRLIAPMLISMAWLAIVAYANKDALGEEQWER